MLLLEPLIPFLSGRMKLCFAGAAFLNFCCAPAQESSSHSSIWMSVASPRRFAAGTRGSLLAAAAMADRGLGRGLALDGPDRAHQGPPCGAGAALGLAPGLAPGGSMAAAAAAGCDAPPDVVVSAVAV